MAERELYMRVGSGGGDAAVGPRSFYGGCKRKWVKVSQLCYDEGAFMRECSLLIPTFTFDPNSDTAFRFVGVFDIDPVMQRSSRDMYDLVRNTSDGDVIDSSEVTECRERAAEMISRFSSGLAFFSGGKGYRVLADPSDHRLWVRVCEGESYGQPILSSVVSPIMGEVLSNRLDCNVFDVDKGVKPDLHVHPNSGRWPSLDATSRCKEDRGLSLSIVEFWKKLCDVASGVDIDSLRYVRGVVKKSRKRVHGSPIGGVLEAVCGSPSKKKRCSTYHELHVGHADYFDVGPGSLRSAVITAHRQGVPYVVNEIVPVDTTRFFLDVDDLDVVRFVPSICMAVYSIWGSSTGNVQVLRASGSKESFHMIWSSLFVSSRAAAVTRDCIVRDVGSVFPEVEWDTVLDKGVYSTSLRILGADKEVKGAGGGREFAGRAFSWVSEYDCRGKLLDGGPRSFATALSQTLLRVPGATSLPVPESIRLSVESGRDPFSSSGESSMTVEDLSFAVSLCERYAGSYAPFSEPRGVGDSPYVCVRTESSVCGIAEREHRNARVFMIVNMCTGSVVQKCWRCRGKGKRLV